MKQSTTTKTYISALALLALLLAPTFTFAEETKKEHQEPQTEVVQKEHKEEKEAPQDGKEKAPENAFTTCSQEAIEARDTSIASSRLIYNTAMNTALTERKNREKVAVTIEEEGAKKDAIKASVETYKQQTKQAQTALVAARKLAWQTFENDIKKCRELGTETTQIIKEDEQQPAQSRTMKKTQDDDTVKELRKDESKSIGDMIKVKFESLKSLFN
jgi:NADH dehydrogenase/NADH:ubiquinone oxidoreductase subunit G